MALDGVVTHNDNGKFHTQLHWFVKASFKHARDIRNVLLQLYKTQEVQNDRSVPSPT
jgi:hypothetical protein